MSDALTGGELVVRSLAAHGVDLVFGIPGTHNLPLYAGCGLVPRLPRDLGVGLVDRGRDRADLARGEVAAHALDLLLLRSQGDHRADRIIS